MHPFAAIFAVLGLAGSGAAVPLAAAGGLDSTDWVGPEIPTGFVLGDPGNIFTHGRCSVFARVYVNIKDGFTKSAFVRVRDSTDVPFAEVKFWGPRGVVWGGGMPDYLQITVLQGNVMVRSYSSFLFFPTLFFFANAGARLGGVTAAGGDRRSPRFPPPPSPFCFSPVESLTDPLPPGFPIR